MALISLRKYAIINEKDYANIYRKYKRGDFKTARKVGNVVLIDEDEPYFDKRFVTGRYVGFRENVRIGRLKKSGGDYEISEKSENAESFGKSCNLGNVARSSRQRQGKIRESQKVKESKTY